MHKRVSSFSLLLSFWSQQGRTRTTPEQLHLSSLRLHLHFLISCTECTEQIQQRLHEKWVVFCYQHKVIIFCFTSRNKFNGAKAKFCVLKPTTSKFSVTSMCYFSQNLSYTHKLWLPVYACLQKIQVSVYKEAMLCDSDSTSVAGN